MTVLFSLWSVRFPTPKSFENNFQVSVCNDFAVSKQAGAIIQSCRELFEKNFQFCLWRLESCSQVMCEEWWNPSFLFLSDSRTVSAWLDSAKNLIKSSCGLSAAPDPSSWSAADDGDDDVGGDGDAQRLGPE